MPSKLANASRAVTGPQSELVAQAIFPGTSEHLAFSSTSVQSAAVPAGATLVRLEPTKACFVKMGSTNPTAASSTSMYMSAGKSEVFGVTAGDKIAVIRDTEDGALNITFGTGA